MHMSLIPFAAEKKMILELRQSLENRGSKGTQMPAPACPSSSPFTSAHTDYRDTWLSPGSPQGLDSSALPTERRANYE